MNYRCFFIVLCWWFPGILRAQSEHYQFTRVDINQGLSHNQISSILKDNKDFMWFGTSSGLNRYDGYRFKVFRHDLRDTTSISDNNIRKLFEGPEGKIWVSTGSGFNIYNPETETFDRNPGAYLQRISIPDAYASFTGIQKDRKGNYWFIHANRGLFKYTSSTRQVANLQHQAEDTTSLCSDEVATLKEDSRGYLWLLHKNGVLEKMDGKTNKIISRNYALYQRYGGESLYYQLTIDADDDLWIFVENDARGAFYYNTRQNTLLPVNKESPKLRLNTNIIRGIVQDNNGLLWIATDHGGINLLDKKNFTVRYLLNNPDDEKSLSQNSINALYKDNAGIIWAGTFKKGISYYHENIIKFQLFQHQASDPNSLPYNDINRFAEDEKGNLWIGANGGGLMYYDREKGKFTRFVHQPDNPNSLSNDVIVSLLLDDEQKLWIGTYFGGLDCFDGKKFIHYRHNPSVPESLSDDRVWELFEDSQYNFWVGTLDGGLNLFDRKKNTFSHYRNGEQNSIHTNYISSLSEDRAGNLWVGTGYGIDVLDKQSGRFMHYLRDEHNPASLSNNNILSIIEDSRDWTWVGTSEGLNLLDKQRNVLRVFRMEDGLPDNTIITILEDSNRNLWLSTPNGLSNMTIRLEAKTGQYSFHFKNYDESDGLQGKEFNENAAYKTRLGELIFSGANGFNIFRPDAMRLNRYIPKIVLTDFQVFNKSIGVGEKVEGKPVLNQSIAETRAITLAYDQNVFSVEFAALSFFHPEKNKYQYKLEGFNKDWLTTDGRMRKATFTNLDPGDYTFRVKASNNDGFWNEQGIALNITVLPPFWKTPVALVLYILVIVGALLLARQLILERERLNFRIEQERQEAHRMHELDMMKIRFFTNVSHEFRTPLTLILTPLDKILQQTPDPDQKNQLLMIYRNARRLLNLVNQLLDFRRMEVQEIKLNPLPGEIVQFIREISYSFSDLSEKKHIRFSFHSNIPSLDTLFDQDKLEKILFNLLSNAFKFTPEQGCVEVDLKLRAQDNEEEEIAWLEISVKDTGIGIPAEKHEKIFERFFQHDIPGTMVNQGSGIGLSITKEFVKLHGGTVAVDSEPEKGSCFTVLLPIQKIAVPALAEALETEESKTWEPSVHPGLEPNAQHAKSTHKKPVVLLVEDNDDFRFYLKDNLKAQYQIVEAGNGKEGWHQTLHLVPDLIVSDVMMPVMNGIELCRKIRHDQRTSHIPVILLTARAAKEQELEGLETGASDYITKPFSFEILQSRIKNLIAQRESLQKAFHKQIDIQPNEISITSMDEKLIQKALTAVEKNLSNPDFSVEELSRELGMSRVYLYKKLLALTGKTPIEFIRIIRLKRAAQLLEKSQLTVAEIAYEVGFNNPKYFTKYFKTEFHVLPSLYVAEKRKANA